MFKGNLKMAVASIRNARMRSVMTTLGVIIGVVSVVTTVSLGEGVKQQVARQITHLGSDLITIRPGKTVKRDAAGKITGINLLAGFGASTLTEKDLEIVRETPGVKVAVPSSILTGTIKANETEYAGGLIIATTDQMPQILNQKVEFGTFFESVDSQSHMAVIGQSVAEDLFKELVPVGKTIQIRGENFIVKGVFEKFAANPLTPGSDFNSSVFIPYGTGKKLSGGAAQIFQILAKSSDPGTTNETVKELTARLKSAHAGEEDFTILKQEESLAITTNILGLMTNLIAGIAAISLLVGGIGIMNVMLVSVTERTREIGIRKAVGATNQQILAQFLTEGVVLSIVGGLIGIVLAGIINIGLRIFTNLSPVITWPVVVIAVWVSMVVGIIFGITPALRAAKKDPIEALRYE